MSCRSAELAVKDSLGDVWTRVCEMSRGVFSTSGTDKIETLCGAVSEFATLLTDGRGVGLVRRSSQSGSSLSTSAESPYARARSKRDWGPLKCELKTVVADCSCSLRSSLMSLASHCGRRKEEFCSCSIVGRVLGGIGGESF